MYMKHKKGIKEKGLMDMDNSVVIANGEHKWTKW